MKKSDSVSDRYLHRKTANFSLHLKNCLSPHIHCYMDMFLWSYRQKSTSKKRRSAPNRHRIVAELYGFYLAVELLLKMP
jgi:hypothetical protein